MPDEARPMVRDVAVTLALAALGLLRWTQLVPMLMAWTFLLLMLGAMVLVNFQSQSFSVLAYVDDLHTRIAGPPAQAPDPTPVDSPTAPAGKASTPAGDAAAQQALHVDEADLEGWIWRGWAVVSLAGWLLGGLWRQLFGPGGEPWPLRRKLFACALAAALCSVGLLAIWAVATVPYNGPAAGWVALFVGLPAMVWLVSAWSLSVSHLLGVLGDRLVQTAFRA